MQQAVHGAKCELATKFWETLTRIERQLDVVEKAREENYVSEEAELTAAVAGSAGAHQRLTDEVANLRRILSAPPVKLDDCEHIEVAAASLGVRDFSGTNGKTPGLSTLSARKTASGPTTSEELVPEPEALATVATDPTAVPTEQVTEVAVPFSRGGTLEDDGFVPPVRAGTDTVEQVPEEETEVTEQVFNEGAEVPEQVSAEDATNTAADHDGMEVEETV
ncbi:unnamed protein product [Arabis nemorensis]|uniref:Uncharacterized protein n=1 Tax=Arabis nemorensis TaxID=586526 RepID=A0A565BSQ1_9BRAS|nr:unnamed protein product [Arabis nemorensis]